MLQIVDCRGMYDIMAPRTQVPLCMLHHSINNQVHTNEGEVIIITQVEKIVFDFTVEKPNTIV